VPAQLEGAQRVAIHTGVVTISSTKGRRERMSEIESISDAATGVRRVLKMTLTV
jgi:hypothetical protein